jgi:hypothetical protein
MLANVCSTNYEVDRGVSSLRLRRANVFFLCGVIAWTARLRLMVLIADNKICPSGYLGIAIHPQTGDYDCSYELITSPPSATPGLTASIGNKLNREHVAELSISNAHILGGLGYGQLSTPTDMRLVHIELE